MIRRDGETLIAVLDGVALLISRDIGPEFLVLDAVWEYELGVSTPDCVFYSRLEDNLVHQIKEKTEDSIRVAPKLLVETDYRWGGFRDACPSNLLWTGLVRYELEKDVNGITNHIVSNLTVTILELYKELYWDVSFWDGLPDTGC